MATLIMPALPGFAAAAFGLVANSQTHRSPLDGTVQTLELAGARWRASYQVAAMKRAQAAAWISFLTGLKGQSGRFFGFDPDAASPRGSGAGDSPLVKGAAQSGESLVTDAWTPSQTGLLLPGDYFGVGSELKMVTASVASDGAGVATIAFTPSLRSPPADDAALTLTDATCTMMLAADDAANWDLDSAAFYGIAFSGIEAF